MANKNVSPHIQDAPFWLGDVMKGAAWSVAPTSMPASKPVASYFGFDTASCTVVVLADGLGAIQLQESLSYAPTLRSVGTEPKVVPTTIPSTTASALTGFATGAYPGQTQMVGYSVYREGKLFNLLQFDPSVDPLAWQRVPTYFERLADEGVQTGLVTKPAFADSGLTKAAFRGTNFYGENTLEGRLDKALELVRSGLPLVYVYWPTLDQVGHQQGPNSTSWLEQLEHLDRELGRFLKRLPKDTSVVLTADHGMVEVSQRRNIADLPELSEGVTAIAGEGRAVHLHAHKGEREEVLARWEDTLGEDALIVRSEDAEDVLGSGPGNTLIGEALVLMLDDSVVVDSRTQSQAAIALKGVHGSVTARESLVPVWRLA